MKKSSMLSECDISVIIVNFNGRKYLEFLLDSLLALNCDGFSFEVVFVDNASSDDSVEFVRSRYTSLFGERLTFVCNSSNLGFAGGNNAGVAASRGNYIVFLNNDTYVEKDWLHNLYFFFRDTPECVMANSKLLFFYDFTEVAFSDTSKFTISSDVLINGKNHTIDPKFCENVMYHENLFCTSTSKIRLPLIDGICDYTIEFNVLESDKKAPKHFFISKSQIEREKVTLVQNAGCAINEHFEGYDIGFCKPDSAAFSKPYEIQSGCGAAIILRKADFLACGMFDERFFMYYEDTDLSFRIKKTGKKIMFCPNAVVRHIHSGSFQGKPRQYAYYVARNRLIFICKNFSRRLSLWHILHELRMSFRQGDPLRRKAALGALRFSLFGSVSN